MFLQRRFDFFLIDFLDNLSLFLQSLRKNPYFCKLTLYTHTHVLIQKIKL